jgi:hypothetical protein
MSCFDVIGTKYTTSYSKQNQVAVEMIVLSEQFVDPESRRRIINE